MGKAKPVGVSKRAAAVSSQVEAIVDDPKTHVDTGNAKRVVRRDVTVVAALHTAIAEVHAHALDPIDPDEADRIFSYAVKGYVDRILLPILWSGEHVLEDGDLTFDCGPEPVAPSTDRHASKLIRKRTKRRKPSYNVAVKASIKGSYAPSRASSRTESKFGGSRLEGSRMSISVRGGVPTSRMSRSSVMYNRDDPESFMNLPWTGRQQTSNGTSSNNSPWQYGEASYRKSSVAGTPRKAVDFLEIERRADIERDLSTRESMRRSADDASRKADVRLKLRSLADPTISLEKEEAMAILDARRSYSRQGTRGKTPGMTLPVLAPLTSKHGGQEPSVAIDDEVPTFRTEDYDGLSSDVVLLGKRGELLVGENCFVVAQKLRQELLLDLQTRGVIQPRIQVVPTQQQDDENADKASNSSSKIQRSRSPMGKLAAPISPTPKTMSTTKVFEDQIGSFESSPGLELALQSTPLVEGVVLKLNGAPVSPPNTSKSLPRRLSAMPSTPDRVQNTNPETVLDTSIKTPDLSKSTLMLSNEPILQSQQVIQADILASSHSSPQISKLSGAGSPKHIYNGEKYPQSVRIRTPACPNRTSRKTSTHSNLHDVPFQDNMHSLHEQQILASKLPSAKYLREFPKQAPGHIQFFGSASRETDWTLPTPSSGFASFGSPTIQRKR